MANKKRKKSNAQSDRRVFAALIVASLLTVCVIAALVANISGRIIAVRASDQTARTRARVEAIEARQTEEIAMPTPAPTSAPEVTEAPTEAPTDEPTAEPTEEPVETFEYLPVIKQGSTAEKKICITVDDCFQVNNLKELIAITYDQGGKLTLFPIGENILKSGMADILKVAVFKLGFEVENHTWSHARIFRLPEEEMAAEIWRQRNALNNALGCNYQEHFFRFMGGDGELDQRSHNYLKQLGFLAIAHWNVSGSDASMETIKEYLKPGSIYLFHTTDADMVKLREFIPYAVQQGYQLVTLNEMFDSPDNATYDLTTAEIAMPIPQPYTVEYEELKTGMYSWSVVLLQERLWQLGYLDSSAKSALNGSPADGDYGESTAEAVRLFQADHNLPATGIADIHTQELLFAEEEEAEADEG